MRRGKNARNKPWLLFEETKDENNEAIAAASKHCSFLRKHCACTRAVYSYQFEWHIAKNRCLKTRWAGCGAVCINYQKV